MRTRVLLLMMPVIVITLSFCSCIQLTDKYIAPPMVQKTGLTKMEATPSAHELDSIYELLKINQSSDLFLATNQLTLKALLQKIENENLINEALFAMILTNSKARNTEYTAIYRNGDLTLGKAMDTTNQVLINDIYNFNEIRFSMAQTKNN